MKKVLLFISKIILIIAVLNLFAGALYHVHNGGQRLGFLTGFTMEFSRFPYLVRDVIKEMVKPERLVSVDPNFEELNNLDYDVFALNAFFSENKWITQLRNLRNDSTIWEWVLEEKDFESTNRLFSHAEPRLPILLKDTSLIIHNDETFNLFRLNKNSDILWKNSDFQFHHAINQDNSGNIWACTRAKVVFPKNKFEYWDNSLTQINMQNGKTLFHKSITQIFLENDLSYLIHGYCNVAQGNGDDPLHLNEIEPALKDGAFWKEGDLFVSLRNRSMIFIYRPSTNEIIHIIQGAFYFQHDIDIVSDSSISIFNNNVTELLSTELTKRSSASQESLLPNKRLNLVSEVLLYDMTDSSFTSIYPSHFESNKIFTRTQGLHHQLSNGDLFIEEWDTGRIYIFNKDRILLKKHLNKPQKGLTEFTHWVRIYEDLGFLN